MTTTVVLLPIFTPFISCTGGLNTILTVLTVMNLFWFLALCWTIITLILLYRGLQTDYSLHYNPTSPLKHIVILPIYKDPVEVLFRTLDSLALQTVKERLVVAIGFESRTPDIPTLEAQLKDRYDGTFNTLFFATHPYGLEGEIAGKCSNANYVLRQAVTHVFTTSVEATDASNFICTTCDADTFFHEKYFEALTADVEMMKAKNDTDLKRCIWQAPLL